MNQMNNIIEPFIHICDLNDPTLKSASKTAMPITGYKNLQSMIMFGSMMLGMGIDSTYDEFKQRSSQLYMYSDHGTPGRNVQIKRMHEASLALYTGHEGELIYTSDTKTVKVMDGITLGGTAIGGGTPTDVYTKGEADTKFATNANLNTNYSTTLQIEAKLSNKVDKVSGKSLVADPTIEQIGTNTTNIATVSSNVASKVDKVSGKSLILDTDIAQIGYNKDNIATNDTRITVLESATPGGGGSNIATSSAVVRPEGIDLGAGMLRPPDIIGAHITNSGIPELVNVNNFNLRQSGGYLRVDNKLCYFNGRFFVLNSISNEWEEPFVGKLPVLNSSEVIVISTDERNSAMIMTERNGSPQTRSGKLYHFASTTVEPKLYDLNLLSDGSLNDIERERIYAVAWIVPGGTVQYPKFCGVVGGYDDLFNPTTYPSEVLQVTCGAINDYLSIQVVQRVPGSPEEGTLNLATNDLKIIPVNNNKFIIMRGSLTDYPVCDYDVNAKTARINPTGGLRAKNARIDGIQPEILGVSINDAGVGYAIASYSYLIDGIDVPTIDMQRINKIVKISKEGDYLKVDTDIPGGNTVGAIGSVQLTNISGLSTICLTVPNPAQGKPPIERLLLGLGAESVVSNCKSTAIYEYEILDSIHVVPNITVLQFPIMSRSQIMQYKGYPGQIIIESDNPEQMVIHLMNGVSNGGLIFRPSV